MSLTPQRGFYYDDIVNVVRVLACTRPAGCSQGLHGSYDNYERSGDEKGETVPRKSIICRLHRNHGETKQFGRLSTVACDTRIGPLQLPNQYISNNDIA